MADLGVVLNAASGEILIAGWRVSSEQILAPRTEGGKIVGQSFAECIKAAQGRGCSVKALLFNVPGTEMPGPFRVWHARENVEFARAVVAAGGEAQLDSRLPPIPASAHHQKFIVASSPKDGWRVAYVGGIDVCLDRWDTASHDAAAERQTDYLRFAKVETHSASQPGWHDVQVRVEGSVVGQLRRAFADRWNDQRPANNDRHLRDLAHRTPLAGEGPSAPWTGTLAIQVNETLAPGVFPIQGGAGTATVARAHERAIVLAEHYIYVEDQYVWPCSLVERLEAALRRGVRVLMVVARDYDAPGLAIVAKRLRLQVVDRLKRAGGDLFRMFHIERDDGKQIYLHSKVLIVDDRYASVGSANFNARSLTNDSELQIGIVDTALVSVPFSGKLEQACRFAHELRMALWAEHLQCSPHDIPDPIVAIEDLWARSPIAPSRRAHPHAIKPSLLDVDPIAEYVTTLIVNGLAKVPAVPLPAGIEERSAVKLAVDVVLRGPNSALLLKFIEELLNPDVASVVAKVQRDAAAAVRLTPRDHTSAAMDHETKTDDLPGQVLAKLEQGRLPGMVDWFDPRLLAKIGVRDAISGTIGQYADQRLMQAASDQVASEAELAARYDYSDPTHNDPDRRLAVDSDGAIWVDYVADLGDGFEATYAIAHLLTQDSLVVRGADGKAASDALPAGQILLMGGDQCYPQGTQAEYQKRLVDPYNWAFRTDNPKRKLFAIPGNHDWYDGLSAFSSLFTSARDRISGGIGRQIGGWRCYQHRSYFAIKLPHDWWIWGPDIQLEGNLDDPQRDYFDIISDYTKPGDKIVICLAEPSWVPSRRWWESEGGVISG
jgi:phosphatidylserine/phosphatidylglycerophosphate/cardiolipin synthase-like enzyme